MSILVFVYGTLKRGHGKPEAHICIECASKLMGVANAIGLPLQLIPLSVKVGDSIPNPWPTCTQQKEST